MAAKLTEHAKRKRAKGNLIRALALATDPVFQRLLSEEYQQAYFRALGRFNEAKGQGK